MPITHAFVNLHPDGPDVTVTRPSDWNAQHLGTATPALHNVLDSVYHSDVLTGAITRGDLLYGNATPKIARLPLGGISGSIVTRDATDVLWSTYALAGTLGATYTFPAVSGAVALGAGTLTNATVNDATIANHTHAIAGTFTPSAHNILSASHGDTLAGAVVDGDTIIGNVTPAWSRLSISIPAANVRNVFGVDNGELRPSWKTALDATNPTDVTIGGAAAPGTSLIFSHRDHTHGAPATWTATVHNVLDSTYHGDVLTGAITRGDILYGNATPKIARLALGGISGSVLTRNATDVLWSTGALSFGGAFTLTISGNASIGGTAITGTPGTLTVATVNAAADPHTHAITSSSNPGAAASILACDAAGNLRLVTAQIGNLGVGIGATATRAIYSSSTTTAVAGVYYGADITVYENPAAPSSLTLYGLSGTARVTAGNAQNITGSIIGLVGNVINQNTATVSAVSCMTAALNNASTGTISQVHIFDFTVTNGGGGVIQNLYGIYVPAITFGTVSNFALYTAGLGLNRFGDQLAIVGGADRQQLSVTGFTTQAAATALVGFTRNDANTNAISAMLDLKNNSTGVMANGFGSALDWYLESSTTADQQVARQLVKWTDSTHASRTPIYIGETYPVGAAVGHFGFWSYSGVAGVAMTVIANATGDVTEALTAVYTVSAITGGDANGGTCTLEPSDSFNLYSDGTDTLALAVAADGSVTVQRTAGADTFKVSLWMVWQ